jgi:hypothetical protein
MSQRKKYKNKLRHSQTQKCGNGLHKWRGWEREELSFYERLFLDTCREQICDMCGDIRSCIIPDV